MAFNGNAHVFGDAHVNPFSVGTPLQPPGSGSGLPRETAVQQFA